MKKSVILILLLFFSIKAFSQNYLDEIKIGIYAKDHKKIYTNLIAYFGEEYSLINPQKFIDLAEWLVFNEDYSSAYQFYLLANISTFQNNDLSRDDKNKLISQINKRLDSLMNKISPLDKALIEKNKFNIIPGRINLMNNLAIMLKNSEKIRFDPKKTTKAVSNSENIGPIQIDKIQGGIILLEEDQFNDEAPFYDYRDIIENLVYPQRAKEQGIEGTVKVEVKINELGNVVSKSIFASDNDYLNSYALNVIDYIKFQPAKRNGQPIPSKVVIPVHFRK